LEKFKEAGLK